MSQFKTRSADPPKLDVARLVSSVIFALSLAFVLALQASSNVLMKSSPRQALMLNPLNGLATERAAFEVFRKAVKDPENLEIPAQNARPLALRAWKLDPLAPKALAILALSAPGSDDRRAILEQAARLNKRDLTLQGAFLEQAAMDEDFQSGFEALDHMLRTHPNQAEVFFPFLVQTLNDGQSTAALILILDGTSPWHGRFWRSAVSTPKSRLALAQIRSDIVIDDAGFDRALISGLAGDGQMQLAEQVYRTVGRQIGRTQERKSVTTWASDYPPFEWQLVSRASLRAQVSEDRRGLEIFARPGRGGEVARRVFPSGQFGESFRLSLGVDRPILPGNVSVLMQCISSSGRSAQFDLVEGENTVSLPEFALACSSLDFRIAARARRGERQLNALLSQIEWR